MKYFRALICFFLSLGSACGAQAASSKIGILVFDNFLTSDVTAPLEVFGAATRKAWFSSYEVILVSATKEKSVVSEEGLRVVADNTIYDDIKLDALIVPSAYEMDHLLKNKDLVGFIQKQGQTASWMASNCSGAFLMGEAGIYDNKKATTWAGGEKSLAAAYPKIKVQLDQNVVVDDKVISTNGGPISYQGAFELLAKLSSKKYADEIAAQIQFNRLERAFKP
jgi:transcriptional regulator GlxA family with amidase domain